MYIVSTVHIISPAGGGAVVEYGGGGADGIVSCEVISTLKYL